MSREYITTTSRHMCSKCKQCIYRGTKAFLVPGKKTLYECEACSGEKICNICHRIINQRTEAYEKMPGFHRTAHKWVHSKCLND